MITSLLMLLVQILFQEISLTHFLAFSRNSLLRLTFFLTHLLVVRQIFMKGIGLSLTKKFFWLLSRKLGEFYSKKQVSINLSFQSFFTKNSFILDKYSPLKEISKHKLKFKSKAWITSGIQKSFSVNLNP